MPTNTQPTPTVALATTPAASSDAPPAAPRNPRRTALTAIAAVVVIGGAAYGWQVFSGAPTEGTDNAYVAANVVQITPQVNGTVLTIRADDTDFVRAGQPLVQLDTADAQVALEQAEAQLAQTVREVRSLYANNSALAAQVALRQSDLGRVQAELTRAQDDAQRRNALVGSGAVGQEEANHANAQLDAARSAVASVRAGVTAAREQLAASRVMTEGTAVAQHPSVLRAAARVREADLALQRTVLVAPVDGHIARRSVQVGQRVQAGAPLMAVVALNQAWVDANFKEGQLRRLRIGQPATLVADVYGKQVEFHGTVSGLGAGTGAAFALLPAQNATGNWIKIVQRVPVRIALDVKEVAAHPLRVGLSMEVVVDVTQQGGKLLADQPRDAASAPMSQSNALGAGEAEGAAKVDARVRRIVAANGGGQMAARPAIAQPDAKPAAQAVAKAAAHG